MPPRIAGNAPPLAAQPKLDATVVANGLSQQPLSRRVQSGTSSLISQGRNTQAPKVTQGPSAHRSYTREQQQAEPAEPVCEPAPAYLTAFNAQQLQHDASSSASQLDSRKSRVKATARESRWAIALWNDLSTLNMELFVRHLELLLESVGSFEHKYHRFSHRMPHDQAREELLERFAAARELQMLLEQWAACPGADGRTLSEVLLGSTGNFKGTVDTLQLCLDVAGVASVANVGTAQKCSLLIERRRQKQPKERRNPSSERNPLGGITDSHHRTPSIEDLFSQKLQHARNRIQRAPDSRTVQRFKDSGTPLIGGASGSMETLLATMEAHQPTNTLADPELAERERIIALHSALLVSGGHHSVMECMLPARAHGYFREVPDPLCEGYAAAINVLDKSLKALGVGAGTSLVE